MTRNEFMAVLRKELKKLPQEEIDAAVDYYEEYFDEAGPEMEAQVIEELGSPKKIAGQIKADYAVRKLDEEEGSAARKGLSAVWWVIIGICSAPVSIPVAIVTAALAICGFAVLLAVVVSVFCGIVGMIIASAGLIVIGVISVPAALSAAILLIGGGLVGLAVFALLGVLAVIGLRKMVTAMVRWLRHKNETRKANRIEGRNQG